MMKSHPLRFVAFLALMLIQFSAAPATKPAERPDLDLNKQKTLYVVGYAHLDTQWRWAYPQVIREFVRDTLVNNFPLFDKFPHYVFNFSGSRRYEFMREYYPEEYKKLKEYVAAGRWFPCGSSVDENDANVPSAESFVRHILYGNHFFRSEFGVASDEFMLPDCFGFPYSLPSILAHCGIKGFSTQKLTWGSAVGIPFKVGVWEGPDGNSVVAALDPGAYTGKVTENLANSESWSKRIDTGAQTNGGFLGDYHYFGTGDRGGAPGEDSVQWIEKSATTDGPIKIVSGPADWLFNSITPQQREKLPRYKGELLLTEHSAGSISSEAFMKRMNRKNELLADSAERASVMAMWLGGAPYPSKTLYDAWDLVLGSQMHDILPGTSLPRAYDYSWNDELLAANQFSAVMTDAAGAVTAAMDTASMPKTAALDTVAVMGQPIVVFNPLSIEREDVVELMIPSNQAPGFILDYDGKVLPVQTQQVDERTSKVCFVAKVPALSFAVFHPVPGSTVFQSTLKATERSLENDHYKVTLDDRGDVSSIIDKKTGSEVLSAPARLAFMHEDPKQYPAWNMDWDDQKQPPYAYVDGKPTFRVVENGPVRVAIEVTREAQGSKFTQIVRLAAGGAGDRIEFDTHIDWQTRSTALKAVFPLAAGNSKTTYGLQLGTVERANNNEKLYEYPHHQWIDLTDARGQFGATVLDDSKFGSDKPDDHRVRLTLLYTPGTRSGGYQDQGSQDLGRHEMLYAIAPHAGDWRASRTPMIAQRLNQPLMAFAVPSHEGKLGRTFSLASVNSDHVVISAIKKAEDSDEIIVRLCEMIGMNAEKVHVKFAAPLAQAREVDGQEREIGKAPADAELVTDVGAYGLKSFAIKLADSQTKVAPIASQSVDLALDTDVVSTDAKPTDGAFDGEGRSYPAEQLSGNIVSQGVQFKLGSGADGQKNALTCRGQTISLPEGSFDRLYVLASAFGDNDATLEVGGKQTTLAIQHWSGFVGAWDQRLWKGEVPELTYAWNNELAGLVPGYVKPATVAWFCTHRHHPKLGNEQYQFSYLFKYPIDLPAGARSIKLPDNDHVRIFAMTLVKNDHAIATPLHPLSDTLKDHTPEGTPTMALSGELNDTCMLTMGNPLYWVAGGLHYTLDGSEPTEQSPAYTAPIAISRQTNVKARMFLASGHNSGGIDATIPVKDVTPPTVKSASAMSILPSVYVAFSEPVEKSSAQTIANYKLDPPAEIRAAQIGEDGRSVTLVLAQPLLDSTKLSISGVKDTSPAGNAIKQSPVSVAMTKPVYRQPTEQKLPIDVTDAKDLPTRAGDSWTINLMLRVEKQPPNRTMIAGFGSLVDETGHARYLTKFANGIHFWSSHRDGDTNTQLDLNKWQMLTATYDGKTLRLYKNAEPIGTTELQFVDDAPEVHIAPLDPWDKRRRLAGEVREMTIWNSALPEEALRAMWESMK